MNEGTINAIAGKEELIERLIANGVSPTAQRLLIASVLFECAQHLSADQVLGRVNKGDSQVSKATVYNTLGLFASKGLVREVIVDPVRVFYDSNVSRHHHIFNLDDGSLTDVVEHPVVLDHLPPLPEGTELESVDLIVRVRRKNA